MTITPEHKEKLREGRIKSGRWGGRPAKYETPEELEFQIDEYFEGFYNEYNKEIFYNKKGDQVGFEYINAPTVSGLTLYLGFNSRQSFLDYCSRDDKKAEEDPNYKKAFTDIIKAAKTAIEQGIENRLSTGKGSAAGQIFILKNGFNWRDKSEVDQKITGSLDVTDSLKGLSTADLTKRKEELEKPKKED